jgi:hypothetical protein
MIICPGKKCGGTTFVQVCPTFSFDRGRQLKVRKVGALVRCCACGKCWEVTNDGLREPALEAIPGTRISLAPRTAEPQRHHRLDEDDEDEDEKPRHPLSDSTPRAEMPSL